jgi:D-alanyl-D-alanine carboxypeptidase
MRDDRAAAIDTIVSGAMTSQSVAGLAILVAQHQRVIFSGGYGLRGLTETLPVSEQTAFSIASISKQFTAAGIFRLQERGLLDIHDRAAHYLPWWQHAPNITIAQLLTHASGISGYTELDDFGLRCYDAATPREIVESTAHFGMAFEPGTDWQYSNTNYVILAAILEAVAEQSYADFLRYDLLRTLDLSATSAGTVAAPSDDIAEGLMSYALGPWEAMRPWHSSWEFGTAGIRSNVCDLFAWNVALRTGRVVSESSYRTMASRMALNDGSRVNYGCGLQLIHSPIGPEIRHSGGLPGFSLENTTFPNQDIDIIVLTNADSSQTRHSITRPIAALLTGDARLAVPGAAEDFIGGRRLPHFPPALEIQNVFLAGEIQPEGLTDACRRLLTPPHLDALRALGARGPIRSLEELQSFRRYPVTMYTYRAVLDDESLRTELTVNDDGRIAGASFCRWDRGEPCVP